MNSADKKYKEWCEKIVKSKDTNEIVSHFRKHVYEHYKSYNNRESEISLKSWMVGVFNFMYILEKKFPDITTEDKLYKLCVYYKDQKEGPEAPFDINKFMKDYKGDAF